jgi:hypothetical protein
MTTASLTGLAASPIVAGFIGGASLRIVFALDVVALVMLWWAVRTRMSDRPITSEAPPRMDERAV